MKARDKKTGKIVEIEHYGSDGSYTVFRNSEGEVIRSPVNFYDNYEEIVETEETIDWEQRRYEIAKEMLPISAKSVNADIKDWMEGMSYPKASAVLALRYADALIEELKKGAENGNK